MGETLELAMVAVTLLHQIIPLSSQRFKIAFWIGNLSPTRKCFLPATCIVGSKNGSKVCILVRNQQLIFFSAGGKVYALHLIQKI
jgi:hypothetical protein